MFDIIVTLATVHNTAIINVGDFWGNYLNDEKNIQIMNDIFHKCHSKMFVFGLKLDFNNESKLLFKTTFFDSPNFNSKLQTLLSKITHLRTFGRKVSHKLNKAGSKN